MSTTRRIIRLFPSSPVGREVEVCHGTGAVRSYRSRIVSFMTESGIGFDYTSRDRMRTLSEFSAIETGNPLVAFQIARLCSVWLERFRTGERTVNDLVRVFNGCRDEQLIKDVLTDFGKEDASIDEILHLATDLLPTSSVARAMLGRMSRKGAIAFVSAIDRADKEDPNLHLFDEDFKEYVKKFGLSPADSVPSPRKRMFGRFRG